MILEITNPSDSMTIETDDITAAGMGILLVSSMYGLTDAEGNTILPITAFGGLKKWVEDHGITDIDQYVSNNAEKIADILDTVLYGKASDREIFNKAIEKMSPEDAVKFRDEWNNQKRSSLNDIGKRCHSVAATLRLKEKGVKSEH